MAVWQRLFETNRKHDAHIPYTAPCMRSSILTQDCVWNGSRQRSLLLTKSSRSRGVLDVAHIPRLSGIGRLTVACPEEHR